MLLNLGVHIRGSIYKHAVSYTQVNQPSPLPSFLGCILRQLLPLTLASILFAEQEKTSDENSSAHRALEPPH
jgi:hypothetical protein